MNLPSPDEQLDLHGPRAQLPFEQTPPQSRAGVKSSHESLDQEKALIVSNGIITSGGTQNTSGDRHDTLVSPGPTGQERPGREAAESVKDQGIDIPSLTETAPRLHDKEHEADEQEETGSSSSSVLAHAEPQSLANVDITPVGTHGNARMHANHSPTTSWTWLPRVSPPWTRSKLPSTQPTNTLTTPNHSGTMRSADAQQRRPLNPNNTTASGFGTFGRMAQDSNEQPPARTGRLGNLAAIFKRFMGFVGPGYIISVGYMDPGNWATDLAGGSSFGYMLLFVILLSNLMAVVLQGLAVKLGVVSGLDLAQACRKFTPKYVNWILYVLAELAIIACDLAEVIGSAIALNLLFKIPLPWGVVITAADVLVILLAFRDDQSVKSRRLFEALVIVLVTVVGICFTLEIVYAEPVAKDVFRGFLPSAEILTNREALYLAIGIIGATVMPHNLYLHSSIVKLRTSRELNNLASSQASMSSTQDLMSDEQRQAMLNEDKGAVSLKHSTIRTTLRYTFWDSTVALTFALYVNSAILIVSAAAFKYKFPDADNSGLADFFSAFNLLSQYLGKAAGYVFAVALLMAGQSSTLTATLAGQIIMEGFLGTSYLKPWVRRLLTRSLAIIPALVIVVIKGQHGLSELLLASQVALSIQLPFAVIPLVLFTSMGRCMTIPVQDNEDKPGELMYGFQKSEDSKPTGAADQGDNTVPPSTNDEEYRVESGHVPGNQQALLLHNFANPWWLVIIAGIISIVLLGLNFYLLVQTIQEEA
ncbi:hypothetical protein BGX34_009173 [Mortierella sp. NVP85]|nr:hypothetical protein BGX34_009173 [Mortierella sp. NVP85]